MRVLDECKAGAAFIANRLTGLRWAPATALAVGAFLFVYYWRAVEHRWYTGPFLFDFGWFNDLASGRSLSLDNPQAVGRYSYYAVHVAPMLAGLGVVSRLLGLHGVQPLALMLSLAFAGTGAMATAIVERFLRPTGAIVAAVAGGLAGILFGLSGLCRSIVDYPHIEILYPPLGLLTLHLLFQRRLRWAWAALGLCLLAREDAGLHLATILIAYLALTALDEGGVPTRLRDLAPFVAAALLYPMLTILWQRAAWPEFSAFKEIYVGAQPFRHLTPTLYAHRIGELFSVRPWLLLTLAASLCTLALPWRWTALTGLAASLPWLLLNLSAHSDAAGGLMLYYGFPFLVTALAPLIVAAAAATPKRERNLDVIPF